MNYTFYIPYGMLTIIFLDVAAITGLKSTDIILTPFVDPKTNINPDMTFVKVQPNQNHVQSKNVLDQEHVDFLLFWVHNILSFV